MAGGLLPDHTAVPTLMAHMERVLCLPQRRPRPQLGTAPLAKKVPLFTGPRGRLEEIIQPTHREGEGLVSVAVPPTPWVDCLQPESEPWENTKALPSPPFLPPPADLATFLCFKP